MDNSMIKIQLEGTGNVTLLEDYSRDGITVPAGFTCDGASVPRFFWFWLPRWGRYYGASIVHDWLYSNEIGTRLEADKMFLKQMLEDGVLKHRAHIMYWCVRIGGPRWKD